MFGVHVLRGPNKKFVGFWQQKRYQRRRGRDEFLSISSTLFSAGSDFLRADWPAIDSDVFHSVLNDVQQFVAFNIFSRCFTDTRRHRLADDHDFNGCSNLSLFRSRRVDQCETESVKCRENRSVHERVARNGSWNDCPLFLRRNFSVLIIEGNGANISSQSLACGGDVARGKPKGAQ